MPSSACVTGPLRRSRARADRCRFVGRARRAPRRCAGRPPVADPAPAGVGAPCNRNEMPAWRTGPCTGIVDHHRHPVVDDLLVLERLVRVPHRRDGDLVGPELVEQVLALHPPDRVADQLVERLAPGRVPFEVGRIDAQDLPDDAAVLAPTAGEVHRVHPQAVGALVDARPRLEPDLEPRLHPVLGVLPQLRGEREHALVQRRLHPLPAPGELAHVERGEDALDGEVRRGDARQRRVQEDRTVAEAGLLVLHARARLHQQVDGGTIGGVGRARVPGERAVDQRRAGRPRRESKSRPRAARYPGAKLSTSTSAVSTSARSRSRSAGVVEVEHHAALPAVGDHRPDVAALRIAARPARPSPRRRRGRSASSSRSVRPSPVVRSTTRSPSSAPGIEPPAFSRRTTLPDGGRGADARRPEPASTGDREEEAPAGRTTAAAHDRGLGVGDLPLAGRRRAAA